MLSRRRFAVRLLAFGFVLLPWLAGQAAEPPLPADATTTRTLKLKDREIAYTAIAGTLPLANAKGEKVAEMAYVAYRRDGAAPAGRPITFVFNGGPGAASAYLHLGALGPRVIDFGDGRAPPNGEARLIDNADTWLDATDLVFVDPVGTGYSRPTVAEDEARNLFWGVRQDLDAIGAFMRRALAKLDRVGAPVFLVGESYGGFRAARLPEHLAGHEGIAVRGIVLVSPALEFSLMDADAFNPLPWALRLPSLAAVHLEAQGRLTRGALAEVERFSLGPYVTALVAPDRERAADDKLHATLAEYLGLPAETIKRWRARVPLDAYIKEIRRRDGKLASRYDGSIAGPDPYPSAATPQSGDPVLEGLTAPLTTAFIAYARDELGFKTERRYALLNGEISGRWDWGRRGRGRAAGTSDALSKALSLDSRLKVVVAHGMTDLVTPYLASRYVIDHLPDALTRGRVTLAVYPGGHMMYFRPGSRAELRRDVQALYEAAAE